jgi:DNA-binding winged helix-turn-helix (wHTH) protein
LSFGEFVLDESGFQLRRKGRPVSIEPRALRLLLHLARNRGRAVPRAEIAAILWPDHVVSDASLKEAVNLARRAVGDTASAPSVVATLRGHGYRFVAPVDQVEVHAAAGTATGEPGFVGRLHELESLRAIADDVGRGAAQIVLLDVRPVSERRPWSGASPTSPPLRGTPSFVGAVTATAARRRTGSGFKCCAS